MRTAKPTTLQDVAREAGVSTMAVSVVLNGARSATRVSDATRGRIVEAASRLRYRPNAVARGLSRRRMDAIGVVAVVDGDDVNLYFLEVLNGIVEAAARLGQNTTIFSITAWHADEKRILHFCDGRVDGMILLAPANVSLGFVEMLRQRTSFVMIHGDGAPENVDNIDIENEAGSYAMVQYLIAQGHRRIAHFAGPSEYAGAAQRHAGYRRALSDAGIAYDPALVVPCNYTITGNENMKSYLTEMPPTAYPTAVFCADDAIAAGCIETLATLGMRVPEDMSVAGFDDLLLARMTAPPLTTVSQPFRMMGQFAVERLLQRINESDEAPQPVGASIRFAGDQEGARAAVNAPSYGTVFPVKIVVRGSVGPPHVRDTTPGNGS